MPFRTISGENGAIAAFERYPFPHVQLERECKQILDKTIREEEQRGRTLSEKTLEDVSLRVLDLHAEAAEIAAAMDELAALLDSDAIDYRKANALYTQLVAEADDVASRTQEAWNAEDKAWGHYENPIARMDGLRTSINDLLSFPW